MQVQQSCAGIGHSFGWPCGMKASGIEEQMQVLSCCDAGEPSTMDTRVDEVSLDKERVFCSFLFHIKAK